MKKGGLVILVLMLVSILMSCENKSKTLAFIDGELELVEQPDGTKKLETIHRKVPAFALLNQDSVLVSNVKFDNQVYVANFIFTTCPSICKDMTTNMIELQRMLQGLEGIRFISHSVNPTHDTPKILKAYAESYGANLQQWDFVTGDKEEIYKLGLEGYLAAVGESEELGHGGFLHTEYFVLVDKNGFLRTGFDKNGNQRGAYDGTNLEDIRALYSDIKLLLKEKSDADLPKN
ncbi:MAG: SCO family protein [Flavobacteriales bacterium]